MREQYLPPGSGRVGEGASGSESSFADEASDVTGKGQDIGEKRSLGSVGQAVPGRTFDATTPLVGVSALSVAEATNTQVPGRRTDLEITGEADIAIGKSAIDTDHTAQRMIGGLERTVRSEVKDSLRVGRRIAEKDIRQGLMGAALTADPFTVATFVVVAVEGEAVAVGAEGVTERVIAAFEADKRIFVSDVVTDFDGAQGLEVIVDEKQYVIEAFSGIAEEFTNGEKREPALNVFETGDGLQVVVTIGGGEGARDWPEGKDTIINDVKALGFVAKVMLAAR